MSTEQATDWATEKTDHTEQNMHRLTGMRDEIVSEYRMATAKLQRQEELDQTFDEGEITNVMRRLHTAITREYNEATKIIADAYEKLAQDPADFFIILDAKRALEGDTSAKNLKRMKEINSAMENLTYLRYYENPSS